jgi:hypothetical protein
MSLALGHHTRVEKAIYRNTSSAKKSLYGYVIILALGFLAIFVEPFGVTSTAIVCTAYCVIVTFTTSYFCN